MNKRTAVVSGASRGIGKAIALRLAKDGFNVIIGYLKEELQANDTVSKIAALGGIGIAVQADVRNSEDIKKMVAAAESLGGADTIVCNAGVSSFGLIQDVSDEDYANVMDTNVKGVFNMVRAFAPKMISEKFGRIINISSMWGICGSAMESVYSASKAAVIGFTKALASELAPSGITVNAVAPGVIDTDMTNWLDRNIIHSLIDQTPVGRLGKTKDVADAVAFLVSPQSSFVTGNIINVSGGFVM